MLDQTAQTKALRELVDRIDRGEIEVFRAHETHYPALGGASLHLEWRPPSKTITRQRAGELSLEALGFSGAAKDGAATRGVLWARPYAPERINTVIRGDEARVLRSEALMAELIEKYRIVVEPIEDYGWIATPRAAEQRQYRAIHPYDRRTAIVLCALGVLGHGGKELVDG